MSKVQKRAKVAHNKKVTVEETAASNLVMVTGQGHRVSSMAQIEADCGRPRIGWRYGSLKDVTCKNCLEGSRYDDIVVPPTFPEEWYADGFDFEGHHANDSDNVPILCYLDGEEWPCNAVLGTLPRLDMEAFEKEA